MLKLLRAMMRIPVAAMALGLCLVVGCAQVIPTEDYRAAARYVVEAAGPYDVYSPEAEAEGAAEVEELLRDGLTQHEAVQVALLNNQELQAAFFRLGMSRADFVQSGLFSNPSLAFSAQFPEGGGRSNIQASLAQNIVDLWQIPIRRRIAQARLNETILRVAQQAAQLVTQTKKAYFTAVAAGQAAEIARTNLRVAEELRDGTLARQQAGTVSELDVNLALGTVLSAEVELQASRLETAGAHRRLASLLGLTLRPEELSLTDSLPETEEFALDDESIVALAVASRLDLKAAHELVEAENRRVAEEYAKVFPDISVGPFLERSERRALPGRDILADTARASIANGALAAPDIQSRAQRNQERRQEIDAIFGPALTMTLPIFDQNQAQIAKARFACEAAIRERNALARQIVQDARQAIDQAATASRLAQFYDASILPQSQKNLDLSNTSYRAGKTSIITVLDAQRTLLATRRLSISARQEAASALAELERIVGQPFAVIATARTPAPAADRGAEAQSQPSEDIR